MSGRKTSGAGIVISYARATPDMSADAVDRLVRAVEHLNEVTPEMEAAAASTASLWHVVE
jgi:hypothetical protein